MALLACAMAMTQIYYPLHFAPLKSFRALESWTVVGRDLLLVTLFATLAWPDRGVTIRRLAPPGIGYCRGADHRERVAGGDRGADGDRQLGDRRRPCAR